MTQRLPGSCTAERGATRGASLRLRKHRESTSWQNRRYLVLTFDTETVQVHAHIMPIQIGQRLDHGFDEPLGLLSDCHRRIEHFLRVLATVARDAAGGPLSPGWRSALEGAVRYFTVAAPKHTADEEISLFPRLRQSGDPALTGALASLDRLRHEHQEADAHHRAVNDLVLQWIATDRLSPAETAQLRDRLTRLEELYRHHIRIEDEEVFPAAARTLDRAQIAQIGREMAARRQVQPTMRPHRQFDR
jgi:hemerythrin-like domain-containing protein